MINITSFESNLLTSGRILSLLMIVGLFTSTALISATELFLFILWIYFLFRRPNEVISILTLTPIIIGFTLFLLIVSQTIYSTSNLEDGLAYSGKYRELLLLPILLFFLNDSKWKKYIQYGFMIAISITLAHSYMQFFGLTLDTYPGKQPYTSTLGRIYGAIILGFLAFLFLSKSQEVTSYKLKTLLLALFSLSSIALLLFFNGRTGIIIYLSIMTLWLYRIKHYKGLIAAFFACIILLSIATFLSTNLQERVIGTKNELHALIQMPAMDDCLTNQASLNRAELYINTLSHIKIETLLMGNGTGSLENQLLCVGNPHNQFLLTLYDNGLIGLILLLAFFYSWWQYSNSLKDENKWLVRSLVIMLFIGSMFNSLLLDNSEAHFYVLFLSSLIPVISLQKNT